MNSHPHIYPWHDGHTTHYQLAKGEEHPHVSAHGPVNDQAGGNESGLAHEILEHYGALSPGKKTNLKFYGGLESIEHKVDQHLKDAGYSVYYAGGKHGKPELASKNYNTKHLMIYDPTPESGGDFGDEAFTRTWRKLHEKAHADTYGEVNRQFGEGRRLGKLGNRTLNEMQRAVYWEHLAAHRQRDLAKQMGYTMSDRDFAREYNTVIGDAVHRAITGKFTDPADLGFEPHDKMVPISHAMSALKAQADKLGLRHEHDTLQAAHSELKKDLSKTRGHSKLPQWAKQGYRFKIDPPEKPSYGTPDYVDAHHYVKTGKMRRFSHLNKSVLAKSPFGDAPSKTLPSTSRTRYHDYTSVLPEKARQEGYTITVVDSSGIDPDRERSYFQARIHHPSDRSIHGWLTAVHGSKTGNLFTIHDTASLDKEHRGKGLGRAMYEALYHHLVKNGVHHVAGGLHTKEAQRVHESIARKHGITIMGGRGESYFYKLPIAKSEYQSLNKKEPDHIGLYHLSTVAGLKTIHPDRMGTSGVKAEEYKRGLPEVGRAYFYRDGHEAEPVVRDASKVVYRTSVDSASLYDMGEDKCGHVASAVKENAGVWNPDRVYSKIRAAGYKGVYNSQSRLPHVVAMLHPVEVHHEEELKKSKVQPEKLKKSETKGPNWRMPTVEDLHEEYKTERGFFECWPEENHVDVPSAESFAAGALKHGRIETIEYKDIKSKFDDHHSIEDEYMGERVGKLKEAMDSGAELPMPVVFQTQDPTSTYHHRYINLGGRTRIGAALAGGHHVKALVIPYPEEGEPLYSPALKKSEDKPAETKRQKKRSFYEQIVEENYKKQKVKPHYLGRVGDMHVMIATHPDHDNLIGHHHYAEDAHNAMRQLEGAAGQGFRTFIMHGPKAMDVAKEMGYASALPEESKKLKKYDLAKSPPVAAFDSIEQADDWDAHNQPRSIYRPGYHTVKTTKVGMFRGKALYHHVISDPVAHKKDDATVQHFLSHHADPSKRGISHISGETYKGTLQVYASNTDRRYRGMGLGAKLYDLAAKHHGSLSSDFALSGASDAIYRKLAERPGYKAKLRPWGKEQGHYLEYKKPQPKKLRKSELKQSEEAHRLADSWSADGIPDDREALHAEMAKPENHALARQMRDHLSTLVPTKDMNGERHFLLHRRHSRLTESAITHDKPTSYSALPKGRVHEVMDGGYIHSAWVPESKVSYSFLYRGHDPEAEVIVSPGTYQVHEKFFQTSNMSHPVLGHPKNAWDNYYSGFYSDKFVKKSEDPERTDSGATPPALPGSSFRPNKEPPPLPGDRGKRYAAYVPANHLAHPAHSDGRLNHDWDAFYAGPGKGYTHDSTQAMKFLSVEQAHKHLSQRGKIDAPSANDHYFAEVSGKDLERLVKNEGKEVASIAVMRDGCLLMGRRKDSNRWTLPGGHADHGEDKHDAAARELWEEAGIKARRRDLKHLASKHVTTFTGKQKCVHAFLYEHRGEEPHTKNDPDNECYEWKFIDVRDGLPQDIKENLHSPNNLVLEELGLLGEEISKSEGANPHRGWIHPDGSFTPIKDHEDRAGRGPEYQKAGLEGKHHAHDANAFIRSGIIKPYRS